MKIRNSVDVETESYNQLIINNRTVENKENLESVKSFAE